jgi:hypothetical protein
LLGTAPPAPGAGAPIHAPAIRHDPNGPDQIVWSNVESPGIHYLFLRFACGTTTGVTRAGARVYRIDEQGNEGFRDFDADIYGRIDSLEYRAVVVPLEDDPRAPLGRSHWRGYRLWVDDGSTMTWRGADSTAVKENKVRRFEAFFTAPDSTAGISDRIVRVPGWVADAEAARIDVGAFRNGDRSNDPPAGPGGDLAGVIAALPSLDSLGVTTLILSSLQPTAADDPTAPLDWKSIAPRYGDEKLFQGLVERAHALKMRVIPTVILDRLSRTHPWCRDLRDFGEQSAFWSFFRPRVPGDSIPMSPTDTTGAADWNGANPDVLDQILAGVRWWCSLRIDGMCIPNVDRQPASYWESIVATVRALDEKSWMLADTEMPAGDWLDGELFDTRLSIDLPRVVSDFAAGVDGSDAVRFQEGLDRLRVSTPDPYNRCRALTIDPDPGAGDPARDRLAAFLLLMQPGVPVIPMPELLSAPLRGWVRELMSLRRDHPALRRGSWRTIPIDAERWAVLRRSSDEMLLVVVNRGSTPWSGSIEIREGLTGTRQRDALDLIGGGRHPIRSSEVHVKEIQPMSGAVIQLR